MLSFFIKDCHSLVQGSPDYKMLHYYFFFFLSDADKMKWERFPICQDSKAPKSNGTEPRTWTKPATGKWCLHPVLEAGRTPKPSSDWPPSPVLIPVLRFQVPPMKRASFLGVILNVELNDQIKPVKTVFSENKTGSFKLYISWDQYDKISGSRKIENIHIGIITYNWWST